MNYEDINRHFEHQLETARYLRSDGGIENVSIECMDCGEVLVDFNEPYEDDHTEIAKNIRVGKYVAWKLGRTFDKALCKLARWRGKPITIPDGDGGEVTYFPTGGYSHRT